VLPRSMPSCAVATASVGSPSARCASASPASTRGKERAHHAAIPSDGATLAKRVPSGGRLPFDQICQSEGCVRGHPRRLVVELLRRRDTPWPIWCRTACRSDGRTGCRGDRTDSALGLRAARRSGSMISSSSVPRGVASRRCRRPVPSRAPSRSARSTRRS
jgi:hypothetical protein